MKFSEVYEPREDSFLTVDGMMQYADLIQARGMVEIGVGSGYVIINLRRVCETGVFIGTDINFSAALQTRMNAAQSGVDIHVVCARYARPFRREGLPNVFVFNPPYLPSDPEVDKNLTQAELTALVGGPIGTEVMLEFLEELPLS